MAVRADNFALGYLALGLCDALGVAHVEGFTGADVIKLKRDRVDAVSAIRATDLDLVCIEPVANARGAFVRLPIHGFTMAGAAEPHLTPCLDLLCREMPARPRSLSARIGTEFRLALRCEARPTLLTGEGSRLCEIPGRHPMAVPSKAYPCKPDIFAATYEAA